jgi:hypothetical protein
MIFVKTKTLPQLSNEPVVVKVYLRVPGCHGIHDDVLGTLDECAGTVGRHHAVIVKIGIAFTQDADFITSRHFIKKLEDTQLHLNN